VMRGLALSWARYVGDERPRITAALRDALQGGDVVFSCGGIGATPDDHTRQCAAAAADLPLGLHPQARELILERMRDVAAEQGVPYEPERADNQQRLEMGVFPAGAEIIPNPYNKIPGFTLGHVHFVPGFPVMAHPMIEWVLDHRYAHLHGQGLQEERSVIVFGAMEATLTPLMVSIETDFPGIRVFSLPSVDHPQLGRHIELGVKGQGPAVADAFTRLREALHALGCRLGTEVVR